MISSLFRLIRRLWRDDGANVAMIVALCAVPAFAGLGFAIDYGKALSDKAKLDNAADEAALVAIKTVQNVMQSGGTFASGQTQGVTQAKMAFAADAGSLGFASVPSISPVITQNGPNIAATITYATSEPTNISRIVGLSSIPIAGTSSTNLALTTYQRIYILVDVSQSMGIGTDTWNMSQLYQRVVNYNNSSGGETGCVFGCHVQSPGNTPPLLQPYTNEYLAHSINPPIKLRIDSAIDAIKDIIGQAQTASGTINNIQIGLYTISWWPGTTTLGPTYINTVMAPSTNFTALAAAASGIDLGANTLNGYGDTTFATSLSSFSSGILASQGTGLSATSPLNYVYLVSDGVQDTTTGSNCTWGHCMQVISPSVCAPIKLKATLGVIYTTYYPIYQNNDQTQGYENSYKTLVYPIQYPGGQATDQIATNMQSCASSPSFYFQASDGAGIDNAMRQLFAQTTEPALITQ